MEISGAKRRKTSPGSATPLGSPRSTSPQPLGPSLASPTSDADGDPLHVTAAQLEPQLEGQSMEGSQHVASRFGRADAGPRRSPARQIRGSLAAPPRRTPIKSIPRPLPPPQLDDDNDGDEEILNPFARGGLRRSPTDGLPDLDLPEPQPPPTPERPDPPTSTPPAEIHSTPSRRPRRSRVLAETLRSSPTRHSPTRQLSSHQATEKRGRQQEEDAFQTWTEKDSQAVPIQPRPVKRLDKPAKRPRPKARLSNVRDIHRPEPGTELSREHDALLAEIAQLEAELDTVARENERIRQLHLSNKDVTAPENLGDIVDVLLHHLEPPENYFPADYASSWVQPALNPVSFLPFGRPSSTPPTLFAPGTSILEPGKTPKSHEPLPAAGNQDLFLQAFTPLHFTSRITILPRAAASGGGQGPLLQQHTIVATSTSSPGLFLARIEMTVNTANHAISSLSVPSIYPTSAASELAPLVRKITPEPNATSTSSALHHNVSILTWAMGSWLRVAIRRAKIWRLLERDLGTAKAAAQTARRMRASTLKGQGPKRKASSIDEDLDDGDETSGDSVTDVIDSLVTTDDLLPYMDCMWMDFEVPILGTTSGAGSVTQDANTATLRVQWRIDFDWTGEASSHVRALVSLPSKWHRADERLTLSNIPTLFDKLLQQEGDVVFAVRAVVALLAGESR